MPTPVRPVSGVTPMPAARSVAYSHQQGRNRNVLVKIIPVNSCSASAEDKSISFLGRCVEKPGEVGQRNAELAAIREIDPHDLSLEPQVSSQRLSNQSVHSSTFRYPPHAQRRRPGAHAVHVPPAHMIQLLPASASARVSPLRYPCARVCAKVPVPVDPLRSNRRRTDTPYI